MNTSERDEAEARQKALDHALENHVRVMIDEVIPQIDADMKEQAALAARLRLGLSLNQPAGRPCPMDDADRIFRAVTGATKKNAALRRARDQFHEYARQHRAKGTPEADHKALVNDEMAEMCEEALSS